MKKIDQLILFIGIILIVLSFKECNRQPIIPKPDAPIVVPDNVVPKPIPDLKTNILYDSYDEAVALSKTHNRPLVLIFSASWCPYCKDLKNDVSLIKQFNKTIVCFIDIEKNKEQFVNKFEIKGLPTSIIIEKGEEKSRHSGYKKDKYEKWLDGNLP